MRPFGNWSVVRTHVAGIRDPTRRTARTGWSGANFAGASAQAAAAEGRDTAASAARNAKTRVITISASLAARRVVPFRRGKTGVAFAPPIARIFRGLLGFVLNASKARRPTLHGRARRPSRPPRRFRARIATREASTSDPSAAAFPRHPGAPPLKAPHAEVRPASQTSRRAMADQSDAMKQFIELQVRAYPARDMRSPD
jgi:hypothetical protein